MIEIIILSLIQGITEFIPVSSSSHLILISDYIKFDNRGLSIDVSLHIGSFLGVITFFYKDIFEFVKNRELFFKIFISSIPVMVVGFLLVETNLINNLRSIKIIGVTTLTSLNEKSLKEIGYNKKISSLVAHQAKLALRTNLDALVCSPQEIELVKKIFKKEIITPGIRFNSNTHDQKRVMTPKQAFKNGSDWLVIGRPITKGNIKNNLQNLINHLNK